LEVGLVRRVVRFFGVSCVLGLASFFLVACAVPVGSPQPEPLVVSAASSLILAFDQIGTRYEQQTGTPVIFNFAASGQLAQQIEQGAPVDLFVSANVAYVEDLAAKGWVLSDTVQVYARGRLTLWTRADTSLGVETVEDLLRPEVRRVAIANPEHAPYGVAARQSLQTAGLWESVQPKLVFGENVRQALQFAETGDVDVAIVPLSLSTSSGGRWKLIPESLHTPIDQALAVVSGSPRQTQARDFATFICGSEAGSILREYGFEPVGKATSP